MTENMTYSRTFPAELAQLDEFLAYTEEIMESSECTMKTITQVALALEEAFVNVANYAYGDKHGTLDYSISVLEGKLCFTLSDSGIPFDPLAKKDPDVSLSIEERQIGGLGIFMVKKLMDDVQYEYRDGKNILTLYKKL